MILCKLASIIIGQLITSIKSFNSFCTFIIMYVLVLKETGNRVLFVSIIFSMGFTPYQKWKWVFWGNYLHSA